MAWKYAPLTAAQINGMPDSQLEVLSMIHSKSIDEIRGDSALEIRRGELTTMRDKLLALGAAENGKPSPFSMGIRSLLMIGVDWSEIALKVVFYVNEQGEVIVDSFSPRIRKDTEEAVLLSSNPKVQVAGKDVAIDWPYSVFSEDIILRGAKLGLEPAFNKATTPKAMARTLLAQVDAIKSRERLTDADVMRLFDEKFPA